MVLIETVDTKRFTIDGVTLARIYQPLAQGPSAIGLYSIYDTRQQLLNSTDYDRFTIDGSTYASQTLTIEALLNVIYSGISDYDVEQLEGRVTVNEADIGNLQENQVTGVEVYSTLAELPATGTLLVSYKVSNDSTSSNNGFYHWSGAAYVKDADLMLDNAILANALDANGNTVTGLPDAANPNEAVPKSQAESIAASAAAGLDLTVYAKKILESDLNADKHTIINLASPINSGDAVPYELPESLAIQLIYLHDPALTFAGFVDTTTPTPMPSGLEPLPPNSNGYAFIATESGTIFGTDVEKGQIITYDGTTYESEPIDNHLGVIIAGTGLDDDGTYIQPTTSNYIDGATSVNDATMVLDEQLIINLALTL